MKKIEGSGPVRLSKMLAIPLIIFVFFMIFVSFSFIRKNFCPGIGKYIYAIDVISYDLDQIFTPTRSVPSGYQALAGRAIVQHAGTTTLSVASRSVSNGRFNIVLKGDGALIVYNRTDYNFLWFSTHNGICLMSRPFYGAQCIDLYRKDDQIFASGEISDIASFKDWSVTAKYWQ